MDATEQRISRRPGGLLTRRRLLTGAAGIAALALAACGGGGGTPTAAPSAAGSVAPSAAGSVAPSAAGSAAPSAASGAATARATATTAGAAATASRAASPVASATARATAPAALPAPSGFPATVTHQYGTTTIATAPRRVVSVGYNDQDAILACGVVPVAMLRWFAAQPKAIGPWAEPYLKGASPEIIPPTELDIEKIITYKPDLITGIYRDMKPEEYQRLSAIAPTLSQPAGVLPFGVPWRDEARMVATALGQRAAMEQIIAGVEANFEAAKRANPKFAGKTYAVALGAADGQYYAYLGQDSRARFMETLGFTLASQIAAQPATAFYVTLSRERITELEADVLVVLASTPEILQRVQSDTLLQGLNVAKRGAMVVISDATVTQAFSMNSVLSLPFAIEQMTPLLAAAAAKG